jgi:predicted AAA+ superfamily ATPase
MKQLKNWAKQPNRRPLILHGVRQVGKTWLMQTFGRENFKKTAYINFDHNPVAQNIFAKDLNIKRIVSELSIEANTAITPNDTLIVFDEVQECQAAKNSLKYFYENAPEYPVIAAGSLLGVAQGGMPVGKVDLLTLRPMTFLEFLLAVGEDRFARLIRNRDFASLSTFQDKISDNLKQYFYVGGMPEAVKTYAATRNLNETRQVQHRLLDAYYADFTRHIPAGEIARVKLIWDSLPEQLAKENKRFTYSEMKPGSRGREYETALQWLKDAGMALKLNRVKLPQLPLAAYADAKLFKLYMPDIGLLAARSALAPRAYLESNNQVFTHFKGALAEQFVAQEFAANYTHLPLYYWSNETNTAEIEFIIQLNDLIIPLEVKSGKNVKSRSLKTYREKFNPPISLRAALVNYSRNKGLRDIPLYAISEIGALLEAEN